ncbi:MAG: hypothetical protein QOD32_1075 [Pyrinomonadaceae bacterium]|nr:hypothetical protein [Pyrinomonadaceae bacterium]
MKRRLVLKMMRRMKSRLTPVVALAAWLFILTSVAATSAHAAGSWTEGTVANAAGTRNYKLWMPAGYDARKAAPLVLMLHGCLQTPDDFAAGARMNEVADRYTFLVVYAEQPATANPYKCWNWFDPAHQARGAGEPSLLAAVMADVRAKHKVDAQHVYAVGVSAGGAMASVMGAAYPDLFAGLGVCAGVEYKAATSVAAALAAQQSGGAEPNGQGTLAYQTIVAATPLATPPRRRAATATRARPMRVIVFHGTLDTVVRPVNGDQVITQWAQTNDLLDDARDNNSVDDKPDNTSDGEVPNGHKFTRYVYHDAAGKTLLEKWLIRDMKHAWSGGAAAGSYTDPQGVNASEEIWRFFRPTTTTATPAKSSPARTPRRSRR